MTQPEQITQEQKDLAFTVGKIKAAQCNRMVMTAHQGSAFKALKKTNLEELKAVKTINMKEMDMAVEVADELERLIRDGNSLAGSLNIMLEAGWLIRIDEWSDDMHEGEDGEA